MKDKNAFSRRVLVKSSLLGLIALPIDSILYAKSIANVDERNDSIVTATKILNPEYVLPMHSKFEDYEIFADRVQSALPSVRIHFPKTNKEVFDINKQ
jgi:hypothetical protein